MEDIDLRHAKEHLEELMERAVKGEDVLIRDARLGTIRLMPVAREPAQGRPERVPGRWKHRLPDPPGDFFDPLSENELKEWYGADP